jgi:hypothetical protein
MEYVTRAGIPISVGRVDRRLLDAIVLPEPQPPVRQVETWGGVTESVPVYTDPAYERAMQGWHSRLWRESLDVIALALSFTIPENNDLAALAAIGLARGTPADYLRLSICAADQIALVAAVYYQSTVTQRGIAEAAQRFNYTWRDKPLEAWTIGYSYGKRGALAVDYRAAVRSGMTWPQFCALPGPEQSTCVAFWMLEDRLNWLLQQ